jgi:ABC-type polysaccharide/polyol phosphate export permease
LDRVVRIVVGVVLIALVFVGPHTPWGWIGVLPLLSGLAGFCPAYRLIGFSTCPLSH